MKWEMGPETEAWRGEVMRQLNPALKIVFAHARRYQKNRPKFTIVYRRQAKEGRRRPEESVSMTGRFFNDLIGPLDKHAFRKLVSPDNAPRTGFEVEIAVQPGWDRWVLYARALD